MQPANNSSFWLNNFPLHFSHLSFSKSFPHGRLSKLNLVICQWIQLKHHTAHKWSIIFCHDPQKVKIRKPHKQEEEEECCKSEMHPCRILLLRMIIALVLHHFFYLNPLYFWHIWAWVGEESFSKLLYVTARDGPRFWVSRATLIYTDCKSNAKFCFSGEI